MERLHLLTNRLLAFSFYLEHKTLHAHKRVQVQRGYTNHKLFFLNQNFMLTELCINVLLSFNFLTFKDAIFLVSRKNIPCKIGLEGLFHYPIKSF